MGANYKITTAGAGRRCCHLRHFPAKRCTKEAAYNCEWRQTNQKGIVYERNLQYCHEHVQIFAKKHEIYHEQGT